MFFLGLGGLFQMWQNIGLMHAGGRFRDVEPHNKE
jgi:hypothetical protein